MKTRTFVLVVVGFLILVAGTFAMKSDAGSTFHHWLRSMHGR